MKKSALLAVALLTLGGCVSHNFAEGERTNYACAGDKEFSYREVPGAIELFAGGETNRLTTSGDGQWSNERVSFVEDGGGATLTGANGGPYDSCRRKQSDWWFDLW